MCTVVCAKRRFLDFSSIPRIVFAASGAQDPFSTKATSRFWKARSVRCSMNVCMNGKMPAL